MFNMRLFQRNGWYHVEYERNRSIALKTKDESAALSIFEDMQEEALRGRLLLLDKRERISISEFSLIYTQDPDRSELSPKTLENDIVAFQRLEDVAGDIPLKLVTKDTMKKFKETYLKRMKKVSINTYIGHIKAGLSWAKDEGYLDRVPVIKKYKLGQAHPRPIDKEDVSRILKYA